MLQGLDHVGIAVKNLDEAIEVYRDRLGFKLEGVHVLTERKVRVALFSTGGQTNVELLEPLDKDSTIAKFIEDRGEGIHHIAVRVRDIVPTLTDLKKNGIVLIDESPREGAEGSKVAFIHPKSTRGVLMEFLMK